MPTIRFYCVICGTALHASADSKDDVMECQSCARWVPVPRFLNLTGGVTGCLPAFPPEVLELAVKFLCTKCGRRLRVDARWEGRAIVCPACGEKTDVPRWSTVLRWSRTSESGKEAPLPASRGGVTADTATLSTEEIDFLRGPLTTNSGAVA